MPAHQVSILLHSKPPHIYLLRKSYQVKTTYGHGMFKGVVKYFKDNRVKILCDTFYCISKKNPMNKLFEENHAHNKTLDRLRSDTELISSSNLYHHHK